MIIIDMGSGNTCRNSRNLVEEMLERLAAVDPQRRATPKFQLWDEGTEPQCMRLQWEVFEAAVEAGMALGYRVTASVFDKPSLDYLLSFDVPFVKLANRPYLRPLGRYVPRGIPIVSSRGVGEPAGPCEFSMVCVSEYPADPRLYEGAPLEALQEGISDHTVGFDLWEKYKPLVYEKHFKLEGATGPDAGPWAATPEELGAVLG